MGKKRIIKKTKEEILREKEKIEKKLKRDIAVKSSSKIREGNVYINSSYNNTIITLADKKGNALIWKSAGNIGFKGTKKGTSYAGSQVAKVIAGICNNLNLRKINVFVKGVGGGRSGALKTLVSQGLEIESIEDTTPIAHGGCRPPKRRRV